MNSVSWIGNASVLLGSTCDVDNPNDVSYSLIKGSAI